MSLGMLALLQKTRDPAERRASGREPQDDWATLLLNEFSREINAQWEPSKRDRQDYAERAKRAVEKLTLEVRASLEKELHAKLQAAVEAKP